MSVKLPVILPLNTTLRRPMGSLPALRLAPWHGIVLAAIILFSSAAADAATGGQTQASVLDVLARWTPVLLRGFGLNILISFLSMAIGTLLGAFLGIGLINPSLPIRSVSWAITSSSATRLGWFCCSS